MGRASDGNAMSPPEIGKYEGPSRKGLTIGQPMDNNKSSQEWIPDPLSEDELKKLVVQAIAKGAGKSPETYHALYGHIERNIQTDDVLYALRANWKKFKVQRPFNKYYWQWKYRILSEDVDGRELLLIIAVDTANREFEVVTRWPEQEDNA